MEPAQPGEGTIESWRIKATNLHTSFAQISPETGRCFGQRSHPVIQQSYPNALFCFRNKRISELPAYVIVTDNIIFEINVFFRGTDCVKPGRIIFLCILEKTDAVAMHKRSSCRARKRLCGHNPEWRVSRAAVPSVYAYIWIKSPHPCQTRTTPYSENPSIQNVFTEFEVDITAHGGDQRRESFLPVSA